MSTSALSPLNKPKHPSYYRSQLYTANLGINPLVTAAHPLFSVIERIKFAGQKPNSQAFFLNIDHEMQAFVARASTANYDDETVFISRYLLAITLDELCTSDDDFSLFNKLMACSNEHAQPDEKFFDIIDTVIDKPNHFLDVLELIYLCLNIGFKGKYRRHGDDKLQEIVQNIYDIITPLRKQSCPSPFSSLPFDSQATVFSWRKAGTLVLLSLVVCYFFSNSMLNYQAKKIVSQINTQPVKQNAYG